MARCKGLEEDFEEVAEQCVRVGVGADAKPHPIYIEGATGQKEEQGGLQMCSIECNIVHTVLSLARLPKKGGIGILRGFAGGGPKRVLPAVCNQKS